mgnify:FL=1
MKTKQYFKYSRLFFLLLVIGAGLMSCEDEDKYGKTATDSAKAVIESVRVMENEEWTPIVQVRIGTAVRIEGNNLENVSAVYFNGYEVVADDFTNFGKTYIEATVPEETPIGHQVADEAVKNTVRVVTDINEFTSALNIISKSLNISGIALYNSEEATVPGATTVSEAELGSKIQIQGAGLDFVTAVYFNGKQTEEKFISQSAGGITLHIPNDTPLGTNVEADADRNTITVETEFGEKFIYSFVIKGNPPTLAEVRSADGTEVITTTTTFGGEILRLVGTHLETVTKVYCNGVEMTEFTAEAETIVLTLPADLPVGSAVKDESVKNTIRVVSDFGEAVLNLEFRGPAPIVDRVSHTLAKAGERIRIYGHNFANVTKVVFPGDVSVTTKGTGEEPETGTFIINEAGTTIDVIVPDGGDALPGALYVEAEADNGGYSYSYMNCKDNIFISSFKKGTDAYAYGSSSISPTTEEPIPANTYGGPSNPKYYRFFPKDKPIDISIETHNDKEVGNFCLYSQKMWDMILDNSKGVIKGTTLCKELAIQFDYYMTAPWSTGCFRWEMIKGNTAYRQTTVSWVDNGEIVPIIFKGWRTLTMPLAEMSAIKDKSVQEVRESMTSETEGKFIYKVGQFKVEDSTYTGTIMNNCQIFVGNFRIVPYTKPVE